MIESCVKCGNSEAQIIYADSGNFVCDDCSENMYICPDCGRAFDKGDIEHIAAHFVMIA